MPQRRDNAVVGLQRAQRASIVALREAFSVFICDEPMMFPNRNRQAENLLQHTMQMCRAQQILASRDESDTLSRIIHNDSEMIARRGVFPREDDISKR